MKKLLFSILLLPLVAGLSCAPGTAKEQPRPKLAVVIVVDQMRPDFLTRFNAYYTGGFRRLIDHGLVFDSATHDHSATETGPGHATIGTGRTPAHNGIVGNDWYDRKLKQTLYCVEDSTSPILGSSEKGGISPANLLVDGMGDWLKRTYPTSKVYSLSVKDRSAVGLGGKHPDCAVWWNTWTGEFVTSSYYAKELPAWVRSFNERHVFDSLKNREWTPAFPDSFYDASTADDFPGEVKDARYTSTFPHVLPWDSTTPKTFYGTYLYYSPLVDNEVLNLAMHLIETEQLGADSTPDLLCIGISQTDVVGHRWGPNSREIEDTYLRLDRKLGEFFAFLDRTIGDSNYVIALSSDHGVLPLPEYLQSIGVDSKRIPSDTVKADYRRITGESMKEGLADTAWFKGWAGDIYLENDQLDPEERTKILDEFREELLKLPYVAACYKQSDLLAGTSIDAFTNYYHNDVYPERSPDLLVRYRENMLVGIGAAGTTHGSPYWYDRHVPIIFMSKYIKSGTVYRPVRTVDIAPTVAVQLHTTAPDDIDGVNLLTDSASR